MAIIDSLLEFSDDQAITAKGTTYSTNVHKIGTGYDEWWSTAYDSGGVGGMPVINVRVTTAFTSATSITTVQAILYGDTSATPTTALLTGTAVVVATAVAGYHLLRARLPVFSSNVGYLRTGITLANCTAGAGKVSAWIGLDNEALAY